MRQFWISCKFERVENKLSGRIGRWRVVRCLETAGWDTRKRIMVLSDCISILSNNSKRRGQIVNPYKVLFGKKRK